VQPNIFDTDHGCFDQGQMSAFLHAKKSGAHLKTWSRASVADDLLQGLLVSNGFFLKQNSTQLKHSVFSCQARCEAMDHHSLLVLLLTSPLLASNSQMKNHRHAIGDEVAIVADIYKKCS